jgi:hypothetical protein
LVQLLADVVAKAVISYASDNRRPSSQPDHVEGQVGGLSTHKALVPVGIRQGRDHLI